MPPREETSGTVRAGTVPAHPPSWLLVEAAHRLAARLLGDSGARWRHEQAVARRAEEAAAAVAPADRPLLLAAAWLHDVGYAPEVRRTGFHPLDGALYLRDRGWHPVVVGLVAHHSGARFVADQRGLGELVRDFDTARYASGPLADALTFADQTTAADGRTVDVETRFADVLGRHGPGSATARAHPRRAPVVRAAVARTERRLRHLGGPRAVPSHDRGTGAAGGSSSPPRVADGTG
ncbi:MULTISPECIES: HDIG domain-containing metalloprotein [unclassified Geodermatophilus]